MATGNPVVPVFGTGPAQYYSSAQQVSYGSAQLYSPLSGSNPLSVVPITDTVFTIFKGSLILVAGDIYSFFLTGDTTKPDTLFVQDNIPLHSDSSVGIRIVNLSPSSQSISINLAGNAASQTEFSGLVYKQISSFKTYVANSSIAGSQYVFEVRDQASGNLLTTYTWSYHLFKNNTLVIAGSEDPTSSTPLMVFSVNNY
jgi:hypothetical protein